MRRFHQRFRPVLEYRLQLCCLASKRRGAKARSAEPTRFNGGLASPSPHSRSSLLPPQRVEAPRTRTGEHQIQKDEAIQDRGVAAVEDREEPLRRVADE